MESFIISIWDLFTRWLNLINVFPTAFLQIYMPQNHMTYNFWCSLKTIISVFNVPLRSACLAKHTALLHIAESLIQIYTTSNRACTDDQLQIQCSGLIIPVNLSFNILSGFRVCYYRTSQFQFSLALSG